MTCLQTDCTLEIQLCIKTIIVSPKKSESAMPIIPKITPSIITIISSNKIPRETTTTPSAGSVSRPENGGDKNAAKVKMNIIAAETDTKTLV